MSVAGLIRSVAVAAAVASVAGMPALAQTQAQAQTQAPAGVYVSPNAAAGPEGYTYREAFPKEVPGLGFAMSKQAFLDIVEAQKLTLTTNTSKSMFLVQPAGAPYTSVVYFFDSNAGPILTEMELRFADAAKARAYFEDKFPVSERRYGSSDYLKNDGVHGYSVKAWTHLTKVYIVSTMPETRWASHGG